MTVIDWFNTLVFVLFLGIVIDEVNRRGKDIKNPILRLLILLFILFLTIRMWLRILHLIKDFL